MIDFRIDRTRTNYHGGDMFSCLKPDPLNVIAQQVEDVDESIRFLESVRDSRFLRGVEQLSRFLPLGLASAILTFRPWLNGKIRDNGQVREKLISHQSLIVAERRRVI